MPKVQIWGFRCSRCGHEWVPREGVEQPQVCPKCKSPYWDRPRQDEVRPEHKVKCKWQAVELDGKKIEFELRRGKQTLKGQGFFSASDLGDGFIQIAITQPLDEKNRILLTQAEADCIQTHWGRQFRFSCFSPM